MKTLKQYIQDDLFATPLNTIGIGNPMAPTSFEPGSGDILQPLCIDIKTGKKYKRRKKFRRYRIV